MVVAKCGNQAVHIVPTYYRYYLKLIRKMWNKEDISSTVYLHYLIVDEITTQ